ncbi:hypothetical protein F0P96_08495 [Hymenobacter busanensis]|uniref:Uncharacterized protein n=1 Tax=Hymenobacter busanensis TaxID=2607656 RepID=A0A7L5A1L2_9BACT|nr:hypothetical protein [Hymenobacter busanensis]KAA9333014.1 hypothetical protein F0P96_08495 [Hymenobacter busanensis]QHJ08312.1 hypothetical protein GUY19_13835 [Hymenobacter busanensis]
MFSFLQNLLPRLLQFSQTLDQIELFVDKPWALIDEDGQQQTYIFRRGGELLMSLDGQVQIGKWDYIAPAQSLLIDRGLDKILLTHFFFTDALLVLARDGKPESKFVLANRQLMPDLDIIGYLRTLEVKKNIISNNPKNSISAHQIKKLSMNTNEGVKLLFYSLSNILAIGDASYIDDSPTPDGRYVIEGGEWGIYTNGGIVSEIFWPKNYKLKTGEDIIVECRTSRDEPDLGYKVLSASGSALADGKYNSFGMGKFRILHERIDGFPLF